MSSNHDELIEIYQEMIMGYNLPCLVRKALVMVARAFLGERVASVIETAKKYPSEEIDAILREKH
jgi:hypothetical protein